MNKSLILLAIVSGTILVANIKVLHGLKEVDVQCVDLGNEIQASKLIVTEIEGASKYTIHSGTGATTYRLPANCTFSKAPKNYLNEKWGAVN